MSAAPKIELHNPRDQPSPQQIVTCPVWFPKGAQRDRIQVKGGTRDQPHSPLTQCNIAARHEDGSIATALLAWQQAPIPPNQTITLELEQQGALPETLLLLPEGHNARSFPSSLASALYIQIDDDLYSATCDPAWGALVAANRYVHYQLGGTGDYFGHLVGDFYRHGLRLENPALGPHPTLRAEFWWRFFHQEGWRFDISLFNGEPGNDVLTKPQDLHIEALGIIVDNKLKNVRRDLAFIDRQRIAIRAWVGMSPPTVIARQDRASLKAAGLLPPGFPAERPYISTDEANKEAVPYMSYSPGYAEIGEELDPGPIFPGMQAAADRPDIGALTKWEMLAIQSQSAYAHAICRVADVNGAGCFPVYIRDEDGQLGLEIDDPKRTKAIWANRKNTSSFKPDTAHLPNLGHYSVLFEFDHLAIDTLQAYACYSIALRHADTRRLYGLTQRQHAWAMRTVALAARMLPSRSPRRGYCRAVINENIVEDLHDERLTPGPGIGALGNPKHKVDGRRTMPFAAHISAWQMSWDAGVYAWLIALDVLSAFNISAADNVFDRFQRFFNGALDAKGETFDAPSGKTISWDEPEQILTYSLPTQLFVPIVEGSSIIPTDTWMIPSWPEVLYRIWCAKSHEFGNTPPPLPIDLAGNLPPGHPDLWLPKGEPPEPIKSSWVVYGMDFLAAVIEEVSGDSRWADKIREHAPKQSVHPGLLYCTK